MHEASEAYLAALDELRQGGITHPSYEQIDALGYRAVLTMLANTPWAKRFERLGPLDRKSFGALTAGWALMIENAINAKLGERETAA